MTCGKRSRSRAQIVVGSTPEEFNAFLRGERTKWGTVAKTAGVKWTE